MPDDQAAENTDRELYREPDRGCGSFYANSVFLTKDGAIGMDVGGRVIVQPIAAWHADAVAFATARDKIMKDIEDAITGALQGYVGQPYRPLSGRALVERGLLEGGLPSKPDPGASGLAMYELARERLEAQAPDYIPRPITPSDRDEGPDGPA